MESPEMLWLLLLLIPLVVVLLRNFNQGRKELGKFKGRGAASLLYDAFTIKWFFSSLFFLLFVVYTILSLVGFSSDREQPEEAPAETDIIFTVDISRSMRVGDIRPDRLGRSKAVMRGIVGRVASARFGVVVYKGDAYTLLPVTEDRSSLRTYINLVSPSLFTSPGTNIEAGIRKAISGFPGKESRRKVILLFSDGESHQGHPLEAASLCAEEDIVLHVIGVGTNDGGKIPIAEGEFLRDEGGDEIVSRLNEMLLRRLAEEGRGTYLSLSDTEGLDPVMDRLELNPEEGKIRFVTEGRYKNFLIIALVFLFLSVLVRVVPWRGTF